MKPAMLLVCSFSLFVAVVAGSAGNPHAQTISPNSLFDFNLQPAVATDANNNFTITWGYLGMGHMPGILAKRYDSNGEAIDNTGFWVNPTFGAPSLLNYDPDIATDSANNSIIAWCTLGLSSPSAALQVVYTTVGPQTQAAGADGVPAPLSTIAPRQNDDLADLLKIPYAPAIAIGSSDTLAMVWSYLNVGTGESGISLVVVSADGKTTGPVTVANNINEAAGGTGIPDPAHDTGDGIAVNQAVIKPVFYFSPAVAFDADGKIVITWTAAGLQPYFLNTEIPLSAVYYSKYDTSGKVVSGFDREMAGIGFNSSVAVNKGNTMIIAWNTIDLLGLKFRIMATLYPPAGEPSQGTLDLGTGPEYAPSAFVDAGNYLFNSGIDIASDSEGNFFVTWGGSNLLSNQIYLKIIYSDGSYLSSEVQVSQGFDLNYGPSLAIDSGDTVIITWNKISLANILSGIGSIYARRYDSTLQALGDEFKVNTSY